MAEVFQHPWLSEKHLLPFQPAPYPNRTTQADINEEIIEHMVALLKVDTAVSIKQDLLTNKATSNSAIYHLLSARLARYQREFKDTGFFTQSDKRRELGQRCPGIKVTMREMTMQCQLLHCQLICQAEEEEE